jgi:hypothetical protein
MLMSSSGRIMMIQRRKCRGSSVTARTRTDDTPSRKAGQSQSLPWFFSYQMQAWRRPHLLAITSKWKPASALPSSAAWASHIIFPGVEPRQWLRFPYGSGDFIFSGSAAGQHPWLARKKQTCPCPLSQLLAIGSRWVSHPLARAVQRSPRRRNRCNRLAGPPARAPSR